jgi:hypothetical protein
MLIFDCTTFKGEWAWGNGHWGGSALRRLLPPVACGGSLRPCNSRVGLSALSATAVPLFAQRLRQEKHLPSLGIGQNSSPPAPPAQESSPCSPLQIPSPQSRILHFGAFRKISVAKIRFWYLNITIVKKQKCVLGRILVKLESVAICRWHFSLGSKRSHK